MDDEATQTPETGPLTIDEATDALMAAPAEERTVDPDVSDAARRLAQSRKPKAAQPEQDEDPEAEAQAATGEDVESEAVPTAEDAAGPDQDDPATEGDEDDELESDPDEGPAIAAPKSWDADARERFTQLPRDLQEFISAREDERDRAVTKAQREAADQRKAAADQAAGLAQYKASLDSLIQRAEGAFKAQPSVKEQWADVDWDAWEGQDPAGAAKGWRQYQTALQAEADQQAHLQTLQAERERTDEAEFQTYVRAEAEALQTFAADKDHPLHAAAADLADAKEGKARREAVGKFLLDNNVPEEALSRISAVELSIAYDAMRWRQAQATARATASTPPRKPTASANPNPPAEGQRRPAAVRPSASQNQPPVRQRKAAAAMERLTQSGSIDDAVAYLQAKG